MGIGLLNPVKGTVSHTSVKFTIFLDSILGPETKFVDAVLCYSVGAADGESDDEPLGFIEGSFKAGTHHFTFTVQVS
jgi:hypothetical protein